MGDEFRGLQKRLGITTLYVTHDQEEAMALSDRVAVMQKGHLLQIDTPENIYQRPASAAVALFFGVPNMLNAIVEACVIAEGTIFRLLVQGEGWRGHCLAGEYRGGPAQLDSFLGFLSGVPAGQAAAASGGNEVK